MSSKVKTVTRSLSLPRDLSLESERGNSEMVATLQSRKEALEAKIHEKNEELKKLCLQEADLTGVIPPEIPLEPGEPPPSVRRRVGTSFSFPQNLINNLKDADNESLNALELECKVQMNIAEAALALANDTTANKAVRRKHRLMYRQSQRRLMELETRLNLLRQGKSQAKPQQVKKKPRPNTTAIENMEFFWNKNTSFSNNNNNNNNTALWPNKLGYSAEEVNNKDLSHDSFGGSLHRSLKSSTSQSSNSPRTDEPNDELKYNNFMLASSFSHPNIQDVGGNKIPSSPSTSHHKRNQKRGVVRRQWDTQSAGGTLLPNQTYPDHSHQPNLSRTQSLGSVEAASQRKDSWSVQDLPQDANNSKEKEWYETSLDSAPSPPLRTSSKLPAAARMLYQMQEMQTNSWNTVGLSPNPHPALTRTQNLAQRNLRTASLPYPAPDNLQNDDLMTNTLQQMHITPKSRSASMYVDENQKDYGYNYENRTYFDYSNHYDDEKERNLMRQNSFNILKYKTDQIDGAVRKPDVNYRANEVDVVGVKKLDVSYRTNEMDVGKKPDNYRPSELDVPVKKPDADNNYHHHHRTNESVYINIPDDSSDISATVNSWISDPHKNNNLYETQPKQTEVKQPPTQPYFHLHKPPPHPMEKIENLQYQAARNRQAANDDHQSAFPSPIQHPPHAITQNEITFDTVVPFESPQNHTVVQAGKWQPYREVTKPFEMSDFYKYSTKFRQSKSSPSRAITPDVSPGTHHKGVYMPLRPMTCQPVESKSNNQLVTHYDELEKQLVEVSLPEIV